MLKDLLHLIELMEAKNMRAVALAEEIKERLKGCGLDRDVDALETALTKLDFQTGCTAARTLIDEIGRAA